MKVKWLILAGVVLMLGAAFYWLGRRPAYLSLNYLKKNLGEIEVDEREKLSYRFWQFKGEETEGFLWEINNRYLYLLNLSGVKRYKFSDKSVGYYYDICNKKMKDGIEGEVFFGENKLGKRVKTGDYINLILYKEEDGRMYIDKVWGYSGNYYLNGLMPMEEQCEN